GVDGRGYRPTPRLLGGGSLHRRDRPADGHLQERGRRQGPPAEPRRPAEPDPPRGRGRRAPRRAAPPHHAARPRIRPSPPARAARGAARRGRPALPAHLGAHLLLAARRAGDAGVPLLLGRCADRQALLPGACRRRLCEGPRPSGGCGL
ncbi:MAG: GcrA cell cycle regulator, partial [uncultured Craurococcus sp.]